MKRIVTIKFFSFICVGCKKKFEDDSTDKTMESECPHCGEWNYSEVPVREERAI